MKPLTSDQIDIKSPLSVSGFTSRYLRVTHTDNKLLTVVMSIPRWTVLVSAWALLIVWNVLMWTVFFWFTIIWRSYRNSQRRDKRQAAQHKELLEALNNKPA